MAHEKSFSINEEGYSVRCRMIFGQDSRVYRRVVVCTHGFGGSKDAANITRFGEKEVAKYKGDAVIAFDWPCHGQDARKKLELVECLDYLRLVVDYAKRELGAEQIYNYSVSYGGYLTLKYIHDLGNPFTRIALRCPGIRMYESMGLYLQQSDREQLARGKEVLVGFDRKMKVDQKFLDDLREADVTTYEYFDWADDILLVHGTQDEKVPIAWSRDFAENNVVELVAVEGADHTFHNPKLMDEAIHTVIEFFAPRE